MPISAPPPSWASIKNKPTTVSGFGITDMGSQSVGSATNANNVPWSGVSGKPTTVSGLGLSDFNASAIAAQASASVGGVGTYAMLQNTADTNISAGGTQSGSNLRYSSAYSNNSAALSGTWRVMGNVWSRTTGDNISVWMRIS